MTQKKILFYKETNIFSSCFQVIKDILNLVYDIKPELHTNYRIL